MSEHITAESRAEARRISHTTRNDVLSSGPCVYCGDPNPTIVDHILPVSRGGTADRDNLAPACKPCNDDKLDFTPEEWKAWRLEEGLCWPPKSLYEQIREVAAEYGLLPSQRIDLDEVAQ